jgi:hypothetical protein
MAAALVPDTLWDLIEPLLPLRQVCSAPETDDLGARATLPHRDG